MSSLSLALHKSGHYQHLRYLRLSRQPLGRTHLEPPGDRFSADAIASSPLQSQHLLFVSGNLPLGRNSPGRLYRPTILQ